LVVVGKESPNLQKYKSGPRGAQQPGSARQVKFLGCPVSTLAGYLSNVLHTRVVDRTGITGLFDYQAANDYSIEPTQTLSSAMKDAGKIAEVRIYPAFGESAADGHSFTWLGNTVWAEDVFTFLDKHCRLQK